MIQELSYRTWIEISTKAIRSNYRTFRTLIGKKVLLCGVVKSNAYGHELMGFAKELEKLGVDYLGVDSISEAIRLRKEGIKTPMFVMGYTMPDNFALAKKYTIELTISTFENLKYLAALNASIAIHLKVDTGMHRQGFYVADLPKALKLIQSSKITLKGLYTHFAEAKDPNDKKSTEQQAKLFKQAIEIVHKHGLYPICHAAATGGVINFPEYHFDMVRVGIGMYGLWPSDETKTSFDAVAVINRPHTKADDIRPYRFALHPALSWKTIVSEIKTIEKGEKIGYDYTEAVTKQTAIAVLPIGYWHGYWRAFSSKAFVLVKGKRCKVLGRVSMDMIVVDVSSVKNPKVGDEVALLGKQGKQEVSAYELGKLANTSHYEIITRINPLIKKIFT